MKQNAAHSIKSHFHELPWVGFKPKTLHLRQIDKAVLHMCNQSYLMCVTISLLVLLLSGPDKIDISAVHIPAVAGDSCFQDGRSKCL